MKHFIKSFSFKRYVERYDESNNQWNTVASMKSRRRRFGLCEFKGKLYAFGGFQDSLGDLKACEMYDPEANSWESISSMRTNRCDLGVAVLSGKESVFLLWKYHEYFVFSLFYIINNS